MSDNEQSKEKPKLTFGNAPTANAAKDTPPLQEGPTELQLLKQRAKTMGLSHSPNIGVDALKEKINDQLEGRKSKDEDEDEEDQEDDDENDENDEDEDKKPEFETEAAKRQMAREARKTQNSKKVKVETNQEIRDRLQKDVLRLVRCRIYNMNPSKADLKGEIVTVANRFIGTIRKMIPFGEATDNGYHIPLILLTELQSRKFQQLRPKKVRGVEQAPERRMVPEYNIEIMEPLTKKELRELANKQSAAERLGTDE